MSVLFFRGRGSAVEDDEGGAAAVLLVVGVVEFGGGVLTAQEAVYFLAQDAVAFAVDEHDLLADAPAVGFHRLADFFKLQFEHIAGGHPHCGVHQFVDMKVYLDCGQHLVGIGGVLPFRTARLVLAPGGAPGVKLPGHRAM